MHLWRRRADLAQPRLQSCRQVILWSIGAFKHAWYLFRTDYTMDILWHDVRYGLRTMWRGKGLVAIAILSLAIGIGANTSVFSAVDVFMLRPLPYPQSHGLHTVWVTNAERGWTQVSYTVPDFVDLRERSQTMQLAATTGGTFNLSGGDRAERLRGTYVTPDFFQVLGVQPAVGRGFTQEEGVPGRDKVAIISDGVWRRRFGGDPAVLGSTIILDGETHTLVGVMPPHFWFRFPGVDVWTPLSFTGDETRSSYRLAVLGRLNDGVTREQAVEEAQRVMGQIAQDYPETSTGHSAMLLSLHEDVFDEGFQAGTLISTVAVAFVLLIACANVANLLLTHAAGRGREVALRGALGAGRIRIIRQFLAESTIIAGVGGVLGLGLSVLGIRGLIALMPPSFPQVHEIGLSPRVLLYTAVVSVFTGIIFGLAPALQSSKANAADILKEGGRGGTGARGARLRKALVVGEVALALVLLVSSALLVQGFARIRLADLGFDRSDVLTMQVMLPEPDYPDSASVVQFHSELASRLGSIPGVEAVGGITQLPLQGGSAAYYTLVGEDYSDETQRKVTDFRHITPGYFAAMDIPVLRGRAVQEGDRIDLPRVLVVNETFVLRHWEDSNPIGQQVVFGSGTAEIIGVVADTKDRGADVSQRPMAFLSAYQGLPRFFDWAIETTVPMETLMETVRSEVRSVDPNIPAYDLMSMDTLIERSLGGNTIMAKIMAALAGIALVLALGGVYGVMSYSVSQRTQELGIRMALGAPAKAVRSMVVRQGTVLASLGIVTGMGVGLGVTRGLSRFLFGVSPFDPMTFGVVAVSLLLLAGLAASYFPALRATRVDPLVALRVE
jgi:putative ABC transport system permease protein